IAVPLGAALDHVADVAIALAIELHRGEHLGQELPGAAHEGLALLVLFLARPLADDHDARGFPEPKTTVERLLESLQRGQPWRARSCAASSAPGSREDVIGHAISVN